MGWGIEIPGQDRSQACVIPVAAQDALAWAAGQFSDADLITRSPMVPEAIFIVNLPDQASYKECLRLVRYWRERGAVFMVARTGNPIVDRHMTEKNGCVRTYREPAGDYRIVCPPAVLVHWMSKWAGPAHKPLPGAKPGATPTLDERFRDHVGTVEVEKPEDPRNDRPAGSRAAA